MRCLARVFVLFFSLVASAFGAEYPTDWYWIVADSSPGAQVWNAAGGAFVANSDATFQTWLAGFGVPSVDGGVISTADDGTGKIKVTCGTTNQMTTGMVVYYRGNNSGLATVFSVTVNDATHYTLQASTFTVADGPGSSSVGASYMPTAAGVYSAIDTWNQGPQPPSYLAVTPGVNYVLANTPPAVLDVAATAAGLRVTLPKMNVPGSLAIGRQFIIHNSSLTISFSVRSFSDDVAHILVSAIRPGEYFTFFLSNNSTQDGAIFGRRTPGLPQSVIYGGTGSNQQPAAGQILVADGSTDVLGVARFLPQTVSGDLTIDGSAVGTLASTITAGGPTGDASHVPQITYDAKGRLTAVTSVAIAIFDSAITYGNQSANRVFAGPSSGAAAAPTFRALVGADLPNPSATTLGGIESLASVTHKWINAISTSGVPSATQPASTDLSDLPVPASSGGTGATKFNAVRVDRNGADQNIPNLTATKIQFTNKVFDPDGVFDNTTSYRMTPNVSGTFMAALCVEFDGGLHPPLNGSFAQGFIYKNGVETAGATTYTSGAGEYPSTCLTTLVSMNGSTDYLEGFALSQEAVAAAGINIFGTATRTYFAAQRIGP